MLAIYISQIDFVVVFVVVNYCNCRCCRYCNCLCVFSSCVFSVWGRYSSNKQVKVSLNSIIVFCGFSSLVFVWYTFFLVLTK